MRDQPHIKICDAFKLKLGQFLCWLLGFRYAKTQDVAIIVIQTCMCTFQKMRASLESSACH